MISKRVTDFLLKYPMFRIKPSIGKGIILEGVYEEILFKQQYGSVFIDYKLQINLNEDFSKSIPKVIELSNKIEKTPENHINSDGSICLGSPIRLSTVLKKQPSLIFFFEHCILPYLYAVTLKITTGQAFVFGELEHGRLGLIEDFKELFSLSETNSVFEMLDLLIMNKKEANKLLCPCQCEKRVSKCHFFKKVQEMRKRFSKNEWIVQHNLLKR